MNEIINYTTLCTEVEDLLSDKAPVAFLGLSIGSKSYMEIDFDANNFSYDENEITLNFTDGATYFSKEDITNIERNVDDVNNINYRITVGDAEWCLCTFAA